MLHSKANFRFWPSVTGNSREKPKATVNVPLSALHLAFLGIHIYLLTLSVYSVHSERTGKPVSPSNKGNCREWKWVGSRQTPTYPLCGIMWNQLTGHKGVLSLMRAVKEPVTRRAEIRVFSTKNYQASSGYLEGPKQMGSSRGKRPIDSPFEIIKY